MLTMTRVSVSQFYESRNHILLAFRVRFPADSKSFCSEPLQKWENLFGIVILQFVGHPPGVYGICFYSECASPTISQCLFGCRVSFFFSPTGSNILLLKVVQQLFVIFGAFSGGDEHVAFYSIV